MFRFIIWFALFVGATIVLAFLFGFAIGFGIPPMWAVCPLVTALAWDWASKTFARLSAKYLIGN